MTNSCNCHRGEVYSMCSRTRLSSNICRWEIRIVSLDARHSVTNYLFHSVGVLSLLRNQSRSSKMVVSASTFVGSFNLYDLETSRSRASDKCPARTTLTRLFETSRSTSILSSQLFGSLWRTHYWCATDWVPPADPSYSDFIARESRIPRGRTKQLHNKQRYERNRKYWQKQE